MLARLVKETALVLALTALLLSLAATVGLPGRTTPERAEASGVYIPATPRPEVAEHPW